MGYTALEEMRSYNLAAYHIPYPKRPGSALETDAVSRLERSCLAFITEDCEQLRFDHTKSDLTDRTGRGVRPGQIPYNMEMDVDRLCLVNAIHRFMRSGTAQDAFDVYFCYLEMFVGNYGKSKQMIEMLAEFESNASSLLMKHRDHYSHSVYVFVIGLALYHENRLVRQAFQAHYSVTDEKAAAHTFIEYWGLTALFHDIGYPFELPFEQVKSYFNGETDQVPSVAYHGMEGYLSVSGCETGKSEYQSLNELLAKNIAEKLYDVYGGTMSRPEYETYLTDVLKKRPTLPGKFMDHAYFSAVLLAKHLMSLLGAENLTRLHIDAFTAIALHNSLFKFAVDVSGGERRQPLEMRRHPLAYLLMLCDELQCWDRTSYGQNSRRELHAMGCDLEFSEDSIIAHYIYDRRFEAKKDKMKGTYVKMSRTQAPEEPVKFVRDIEEIVQINQPGCMGLRIEVRFRKNDRDTKLYLSSSNFMHLYYFAVALNARYQDMDLDTRDNEENQREIEAAFDELSLEYKLSNILQAKAFAGYLNQIGCFYTDKPVAYEMLDRFSAENMDVIGPLEHTRWVEEKRSMGWTLDDAYTDLDRLRRAGIPEDKLKQASKDLRELTRTHKLMIPDYEALDKSEQDKDTEPMNRMLQLIEEYDGLRIYKIDSKGEEN